MKITKYVHSCLLVEEQGKTALIDPGSYTFQSKALDVRYIEKLDFVLITHEHSDHLHIPFLKEILAQFPNVEVITNPGVDLLLEREGIRASSKGNEHISLTEAPHERIFSSAAPANVLFHVFSRLTHPGDSFQFKEAKEVLALPFLWSPVEQFRFLHRKNRRMVMPDIHNTKFIQNSVNVLHFNISLKY